ncbi:hypothetical protein HAX54_016650 [Datura stramonium]|uniref:Uncharacterized protein n=1 Tax=Datura stramonium TaxID=4076 RepID=A0ABS8Y6K0_DATST|nr:hypothetical protein [Datura stramonium]
MRQSSTYGFEAEPFQQWGLGTDMMIGLGGRPAYYGHLRISAFRDEAFWRSQVNFRPPNPATDEKAYGVREACTLSHSLPSKGCLRTGQTQQSDDRERVPHWKGTGDGHLKAHHDLQATPARPGKATRLRCQRDP